MNPGVMCGVALVALSALSFSVFSEASPELNVNGSVQIQAQKALWDNASDGNLDDFWGRANFGATFKSEGFSSALNIRAFPEGWGFEPLTGLSVQDSLVAGVSKTQIARFIIEQAWVKYSWSWLDLRVGRYFTTTSKSIGIGNLIDQNPGATFQGKVAYHNALEGIFKAGPVNAAVMLGAGDKQLNTGYLRLFVTAGFFENALAFGAGYRANVFDRVYDGDAEIYNRFALTAEYAIIKDLRPYVEVAFLDNSDGVVQSYEEREVVVPFVFGVTIPAGKFLNSLVAEMEFLADRVVDGEDVPVQWSLYIDKKAGSHARFQAGLFSDPEGDMGDVRFALRFTGSLK